MSSHLVVRACFPVVAYAANEDAEGFACVCNCGWTGPLRMEPVEAEADGVIHLSIASIGASPGRNVIPYSGYGH